MTKPAAILLPQGPTPALNMDARQGVSAFGGGGSNWADASGSPVFVPRDAAGPTYNANGLAAGKPALVFGTGTGLKNTAFSLNPAAFSVVAVLTLSPGTTGQSYTLFGPANTGGAAVAFLNRTIQFNRAGETTIYTAGGINYFENVPFVLALSYDGANLVLRTSKVTRYNGAAVGGFSSQLLYIGTSRVATTNDMVGPISALKAFNTALTLADLMTVEAATAADWGV